MNYALVIKGAIAQYPYSFNQLRRDNPDVSYPAAPDDARLADFGVVRVEISEKPSHDPTTENLVKVDPALVNGKLVQEWAVEDAHAADVADRRKQAADVVTSESVKADPFVAEFLAMTPAEVNAYIENNTANLAETRALINKMALMLLVLARPELRDDK